MDNCAYQMSRFLLNSKELINNQMLGLQYLYLMMRGYYWNGKNWRWGLRLRGCLCHGHRRLGHRPLTTRPPLGPSYRVMTLDKVKFLLKNKTRVRKWFTFRDFGRQCGPQSTATGSALQGCQKFLRGKFWASSKTLLHCLLRLYIKRGVSLVLPVFLRRLNRFRYL